MLLIGDSVGRQHVKSLRDPGGTVAQRFHARPGTVYLVRPDLHVLARWRTAHADAVARALARAIDRARRGA